ncbi:MAG: ribokinase, partial [Verrucomicrobiota bacterium]
MRARSEPAIVVIGSLNVDLIASVAHLPAPGETIAAHAFSILRGGKGANQLLAAARHGARTAIIGCVGADEHGAAYREFLLREGIDLAGLATAPRENTGTALITVDAAGENQIVYSAGANGRLGASRVRAHAASIRAASLLLLQMETPVAALVEGIRIANRAGVPVVFNPSPLRDGFPWGTLSIDTLVVNEGEAAAIFRQPPGAHLAVIQREMGIRRTVITRGADPTLCIEENRFFEVPTLPVKAIDTVGAGDAFAGVLAVRLAEGEPLEDAV